MKSMKIGIGAASLLLAVAGCKTTTVTSIPGASVKHDQITSSAPAQVDTWFWNWWFTNGKNITVSKDGYAQKSVRLSFATPATINVNLDRKFNVTANEQGATVYVDGVAKGKTPLKGVAINDSGSSVVSVKKQGWLEAKMTPNPETPTDINLVMDQDGSGRRLLELMPTQNGVSIRTTPIFSDTEVGENSPNVSSVKRVTSAPQTEYIQDFSLLPDGKTMVVSIIEEYMDGAKLEYRSNIWKMNTSIAGAPRAAVTTGNFHDITPNAAFDGKMLYFGTTRNGKLSVCRLNMEKKSGIATVNQANTADYSPALHPNGNDLLFAAVLPGTPNPAYLWSLPIKDRGLPSQLREGYAPQWSPDGKKLLFIKGNRDKNQAKIWVCDADGGNPTQLSMGAGEFNDIDARWSVDGKKIVFASNRGTIKGKKNYDIWVMGADGDGLTQLTTNGSCDDKPVFAPDGKTVFFRSNRGLVWDIWVMQIGDVK